MSGGDRGRVGLVTVKSAQTADVASRLGPLLHAHTASLQNGVDNEEKLAAALGDGHVVGGAAYIFATIAEPGVINHTGGPTAITVGEWTGGTSERVERLVAACRSAGAHSFPEVGDFFPAVERYAELMVEAGADAIELNLYSVAADPWRSGPSVESTYLEVVRLVRRAVDVPLAVKLSPYLSSTAHFARCVVEAGADGLVLFNRFYQPDIDLDTLDVLPRVELSDPRELRLPLRWLAILRPQLRTTSLAATTGVHSGLDAAKALLVGADAVMMTSALLRHGPRHLARVEAELAAWLAERDYVSVDQLRGSVSHQAATDPTGFERANYLRTLASYRLTPVI